MPPLGVPAIVGNQRIDEIQLILMPERDQSLVEAGPLLDVLQPMVRAAVWARLRSATNTQGRVSLKTLTQIGLPTTFDEQTVELHIKVPPALRRPTTISFGGHTEPHAAERPEQPSAVSGYLNWRSGLDYIEQSTTGIGEGRQPYQGDFEAGLNIRNWVLQGTAHYLEGATSPWQRGPVQLVRDEPKQALRWAVGDLSYPTSGFQSFQPLGGFTVARNFSLQPYRVTQPTGRASFLLKSASKVEVLVNGQPVQTLQLAAGEHNLRDFLFASGANHVELRITDAVGHVETIPLNYYYDTRLLAAGEQEFAYSVGEPATATATGYNYATGIPTFSVFHRIGLTDRLTAGANLQGNDRQQMFGLEAVTGTPYGNFRPDLAVSRGEGAPPGYAGRLEYEYSNAASTSRRIWQLSAQYLSPFFSALGAGTLPLTANSTAWELSVSYSQRLPWDMTGGVGASYELGRENYPNLTGVNLEFSKSLGRGASVDLTLDRRDQISGPTEYRAYISLTWSFPRAHQTARASYDSYADSSRLDWDYYSPNPVGGLSANVGLQRQSGSDAVSAGAHYTGYRADVDLSHDVTTPTGPQDQLDSRTSLRFGTALVFAGGHWAISRPISDSFAIVVPHPGMPSVKIGVDPVGDSYQARSSWLGPAVVPDLSSYYVRNLTIDAPDLPIGYDLGPRQRTVHPTYHSGTVISVGSAPTVLLTGVLNNTNGVPVSLKAGQIVSLAQSPKPPIEFFTNQRGRFVVEGLEAGRYELKLYAEPKAVVQFTIPKGKVGTYRAGTLQLVPSGGSAAAGPKPQ